MGKRCKCEVCGAHYSARVGHTCLADASPAGCADVEPVDGKASQRTRVSAADRRKVEVALLRLMPLEALDAWRFRCEERRDSAEDSQVWHYWHGQLSVVRGILERRECPPPRSRGREMPSVDTPLCSCGAASAPHDILCVDCAARADANIACLRELESQDVPADDYADLVNEVKSILSPSAPEDTPFPPQCGWCGAAVPAHGYPCAECSRIVPRL